MRPLLRALSAAAAPLVVCALAVTCGSVNDARRSAMDDVRAAVPSDAPLRVFATGDTRGYLEPCGCEVGQVGGVPRRATYLRAERRPGDLWIDLGNFTSGTEGVRRLRREGVLDALAVMHYDVLVPGRAEILDGTAFDEAARSRGVPVICANLVGADGRPVFEPYVIRNLPDGRRVAVVGLADVVDGAPEGRSVLAPAVSLRTIVLELEGRADVVIAATSLSEPAALDLAVHAPGVALVLAGTTPEPDVPFTTTPNALLGVVGHLGGYVARVDFGRDLRPATTWRAWLDESVADDPAAAAIVRRYKDAVSALDVQYVEKVVDGRRKESYAGSVACATCHRAEFGTWKKSLHAVAMRTLVSKESQRDPDCVPCHLVDVPEPGRPLDPDALGVGCEACHGGSAAHVADPAVQTPARDGGRSLCASQCHHPPEVKTFDLEARWALIRHGGK